MRRDFGVIEFRNMFLDASQPIEHWVMEYNYLLIFCEADIHFKHVRPELDLFISVRKGISNDYH